MKRSALKRSDKPMAAGGLGAFTKHQQKIADKLVDQVGCAVCRFHMGIEDSPAEIHHMLEGQRKLSHYMIIPLCPIHHRQGVPGHPSRHSVNGMHGGLEAFEKAYGTEQSLLEACERWINEDYSYHYEPQNSTENADDRHTDTDAHHQPDDGNARAQVEQLQAFNSPVHISVTHYRARLCDPDNLNAKGVIDGLVEAGILQDDSAAHVKAITHDQIKVKGYSDEKTRITLTEVAPKT